jgi:glycosyltransferase involved in cell wall biosynthesis
MIIASPRELGSSRSPLPAGVPRARRPLSVCHVWDGDYPWDVRVEKVSRALTDGGHDVHLVARNTKRQPLVERMAEATVHRLAPLDGAFRRFSAASMFPAFFNPRWGRAIERVARETKSDVIVCRDLPLMIPAIRVARRLGIPVLFDMAENYPAMMRSRWATGHMGGIDHLVRNPRAADAVERWVLPRVDGVMVVVEESGERLVRLGVAADKVVVVSNTPPRSRLDGAVAVHDEGPLEVVYLGLLEAQRGIGALIDAMALLRDAGDRVRLTMYGDGLEGPVFRAQAARLGLDERHVRFMGRVANAEALAALPLHHVGMIPHVKDESWDTTIPNKLFDYMACGLAVVTSDCVPAARVVTETGCGRVYADRDARALAAALRSLADPRVRRRAAAAGRDAVAATYHWEADVRRMLDLIDAVTPAAAARGRA